MNVGVIGCGNMGGGMARQLLNAEFAVTCFDPDEAVRQRMSELGANVVESAAQLASQCTIIVLSLPTADIVRSVMHDMLDKFNTGTIVLDTSTSIPATSQSMAALGEKNGIAFVDGPVSGGPAASQTGTMTMLLGGDAKAIAKLKPITDVLTSKTVVVGASGSGHAAKIANNMLCAANLVLVTEAVRLAESAGVDATDLLEGVNAGSGRSGVSEVNFPKWVLNGAFDSGFTMGLMRKDIRLAIDLAQQSGVALQGFSEIAKIWLDETPEIADSADFNEISKYTKQT